VILSCRLCGAELPSVVKGEWFDTRERCVECGVAPVDPPAALAPSGEDVEYRLDEWPAGDRRAVTSALAEAGVPYRWEPDLVLVVPASAASQVNRLIEEVESASPADDLAAEVGLDGGEEAQEAMAELFVAADRLAHAPSDPALAAELTALAQAVNASLPPFGVDQGVWRGIRQLAAAAAASTAEETLDEERVSAEAKALRDVLRTLV
jgi:hypothetical protein